MSEPRPTPLPAPQGQRDLKPPLPGDIVRDRDFPSVHGQVISKGLFTTRKIPVWLVRRPDGTTTAIYKRDAVLAPELLPAEVVAKYPEAATRGVAGILCPLKGPAKEGS